MAKIKTIAAGQTHPDGLCIGDDPANKLAFNGATPITRPASAAQAIATDATTTMNLANALRLALVNLGLIKGAA